MKKSNHGFTLVELIIVIAVIGILAAILIPVFSNVIDKANSKSALSDARNAMSNYIAEKMLQDTSGGGTLPENIVIMVEKAGKIYAFGYDAAVGGAIRISNANLNNNAQTIDEFIAQYSYNGKNGDTLVSKTTYDADVDGYCYLVPAGETNPAIRSTENYKTQYRYLNNELETVDESTAIFHGKLLEGTFVVSNSAGEIDNTPKVVLNAGGSDLTALGFNPANVSFKKNGAEVNSIVTFEGIENPTFNPSEYTAEYATSDFDFAGWNKTTEFDVSGTVTLIASWTANTRTVDITFRDTYNEQDVEVAATVLDSQTQLSMAAAKDLSGVPTCWVSASNDPIDVSSSTAIVSGTRKKTIDSIEHQVISTLVGWNKINDNLAGNYALEEDVALDGNPDRIGDSSNYFTGVFNGQGYALSSQTGATLNISEAYGGLFAVNFGNIINMTFAFDSVVGQFFVGALCGYNAGYIGNCHVVGNLVEAVAYPADLYTWVGGLAAYNVGTIELSSAMVGNVKINLGYSVGGLVGGNEAGIIDRCFVKNTKVNDGVNCIGSITDGTNSHPIVAVGGLVGMTAGTVIGEEHTPAVISNCYVVDTFVQGSANVGHLVGAFGEDTPAQVTNCYVARCTSESYYSGDKPFFAEGTVSDVVYTGCYFFNDAGTDEYDQDALAQRVTNIGGVCGWDNGIWDTSKQLPTLRGLENQ